MGLFDIFKRKRERADDTPAKASEKNAFSKLKEIEKNAIEFTSTEASDTLPVGSSKIGGKPHLPENFKWPYYNGVNYDEVTALRPLSFLAQINLVEVASLDSENVLPHTGFLYFFFELETMRWGFSPEDKGCARVYYYDAAPEQLQATDFPIDLDVSKQVPEVALRFKKVKNIPSFEEFGDLYKFGYDDYEEAAEKLGVGPGRNAEDVFKLLGYADLIQGSILSECEMVRSGLDCGSLVKLSEAKKKEIYESSRKWVLLAQFGTITDELMFGDCGCIYYYIHSDDLEKRNFEDIHLSLQCS